MNLIRTINYHYPEDIRSKNRILRDFGELSGSRTPRIAYRPIQRALGPPIEDQTWERVGRQLKEEVYWSIIKGF